MRFHIVKRDSCPFWKKLCLYLAAVAGALVLGGLLLLVMGVDPIAYYQRMFTMGMVGNKIAYKTFENYLKVFVPLVLTSVALSLSFKMRFWNIGGEGQFILGAVAAAAVALLFFLQPEESNFLTASVVLEGETIAEYELSTLTGPVTLVVDEAPYPLTIQAEPGRIRIAESACPSQDCVHTGWISRAGQQIICLPDKLVISLSGSGSQEFDAISG